MDGHAFEMLRQKHGLEYARQQRWQGWLTDAFNKLRPAGRRFQLYTDFKPMIQGPDGMMFAPNDEAWIELWEDLGYNGAAASWAGCRVWLPRSADAARCEEAIVCAFKAEFRLRA